MNNDLLEIEQIIGYSFANKKLLRESLTHQSYANESGLPSYERLEFLGDAVLELVVSKYIYENFSFDAGVSSKLRAALVSTEYLNNIVLELGLQKCVLKSKSLPQLSKKNTADIFESLVGAVYADGGFEAAKELINKFVIRSDENVGFVLKNSIDYKTTLQEKFQKCGTSFEYKLLESRGQDHNKTFVVGLFVDGVQVEVSEGKSKQLAEENCAKMYLSKL